MKRYVQTALDTLAALDCRLDHKDRELRTDRWRFTHLNAPDEFFTLSLHSSETAARAVVQRARVAAGLATSEASEKPKAKANQRRKQDREAEHKRRETVRALAEARDAEVRTKRIEAQAARNHQDLDRLMRGPTASSSSRSTTVIPDTMLTAEQAADCSGVTDKAVRRAIASGALEAYRCGKQVRVKGADLRKWLAAS